MVGRVLELSDLHPMFYSDPVELLNCRAMQENLEA